MTDFAALVEEHYMALRRIAERSLATRRGPAAMSPTSLVAESVIRLLAQRAPARNAEHLRGLATVFMARILSDETKSRMRVKRGAGRRTVPLDDFGTALAGDLAAHATERTPERAGDDSTEHDALIDAMMAVADSHPRAMELVTLHLVGGIELARAAELVGVSERTAYRDLEIGRAEFVRHLQGKVRLQGKDRHNGAA